MSGYLVEFIYLLIAAVIMVPIAQAVRLGAVPGFLLAGVFIGPFGLELIHNVEHIAHIAEFGVVLLLFLIGMEMKPAFLWRIKRLVFGLGALQVILTGAVISLLCFHIFHLSFAASVLIGPALALSSTAFVLQLLKEKKAINSEYGRTSVAILLMQDLAVVPLLALIPLLSDGGSESGSLLFGFVKSVAILVAVIAIGRTLLNPILHRVAMANNPDVFTASALLIVFGTAYITEFAGLSMAMGAFIAGLLVSDSAFRHQVKAEIDPFRGVLLGIFFMSMGMSLNLTKLAEFPLLVLGLVIALIAIKAIMVFGLARIFSISQPAASASGLILGQSGEFALVLFSIAATAGLLDQHVFQILLLVVLISMLVTPLLAYAAHVMSQKQPVDLKQEPLPESVDVVIAGFGRVGRQIGELLKQANIEYVAIDQSASLVKTYQAKGYPVFFGDVCKPELLNSAGIKQAKYVLVTVNDPEVAADLVETISHQHAAIKIFARGHNSDTCKELIHLGAEKVVSENLEASIELSKLVLTEENIDSELQRQWVKECKERYYRLDRPE